MGDFDDHAYAILAVDEVLESDSPFLSPSTPSSPAPYSRKFASFLVRHRYLVLTFWGTSTLLCSYFAASLFGATTASSSAPSGSPAASASAAFANAFPHTGGNVAGVILIESLSGAAVIDETSVRIFSTRLNSSLYAYEPSILSGVQGYFLALESGYSIVAQNFVGTNCTIIVVSISEDPTGKVAMAFSRYISEQIVSLSPPDWNCRATLVGIPAFLEAMQVNA